MEGVGCVRSVLEFPPFRLTLLFHGSELVRLDLCSNENVPVEGPELPLRRCPPLVQRQLKEYFQGTRRTFTFSTRFLSPSTSFQRSVWNTLKEIPYGEARSYKWLAERVARGGAYRAVGSALGKNPLPIVFPCHRVISSNGAVGGFSSGIEVKRRLLRLEGFLCRR